jgi:hypothetical protein
LTAGSRTADPGGESLVASFRTHLMDSQGDTYRGAAQQNASSIARRFTLVHGFKAVLSEELAAIRV